MLLPAPFRGCQLLLRFALGGVEFGVREFATAVLLLVSCCCLRRLGLLDRQVRVLEPYVAALRRQGDEVELFSVADCLDADFLYALYDLVVSLLR